MTINLDKNAEKKLKKELKNILVQANVICGDRLDGGTIFGMLGLDTAIFQNKKDKNKTYLKDFISESPMYYFFNQQLSEFIRQHNEYDKDAETKKLSDLKGLEDINDVVDNLVTDFKSLPWSYSLLLFLDDSLTESFKGMSAINVTDKRISFIKVNETFCKNFPQIKKRKIGLFVSDETAIKIDNYCIQIFEDG
ncbi:MAG: hypothetical protein HRU28_13285, partial [Rhizobiales bacterium]|nr:hypothetical protein [Hyphomicrobiales bacterium]